MKHVHIGAGRIGLGLVGELAKELGFDSVFLNRDSGKKHLTVLKSKSGYKLDVEGETKDIQPLDFNPTS
jgi:mannitol-1-phosphate/altronate dehydrogenase